MTMKTSKKFPVLGDESSDVLKYQKLLQKAGSTIKPCKVFSIGMASAIRAFQKKNGLKVTGALDAKTVAALEKAGTVKKAVKK